MKRSAKVAALVAVVGLACSRFDGAFHFDTQATGGAGGSAMPQHPPASGSLGGDGAIPIDASPVVGDASESADESDGPSLAAADDASVSITDADDGPDAAADGPDGSAGMPCSDVTCPFTGSACVTQCNLGCPANATCIGSCGSQCSATCAAGSSCSLVAGNHAIVTCLGSSCHVTIGDNASVTCQSGATCDIVCTDDCSVTCSTNSHCTLKCPGKPNASMVSGSGACTSN